MKAITIDNVIHTQGEYREFNNYSTSGVDDLQWEDWGFRDITEPILAPNERSTGKLVYVPEDDNYTYTIITLTNFDVESELLSTLKLSSAGIAGNKLEADGRLEYEFMRNKIRSSLSEGVITLTENKLLRRLVNPILSRLKDGDWDLVKDDLDTLLIDNPTVPVNSATIISHIQNRVDTYVAEKLTINN